MSKFYINDNEGRKYYAYQYQNDEIKYINLNNKDIANLLSSVTEGRIIKVHDSSEYMEIVFENGFSIVIDNLKIFSPHKDNQDRYFIELLTKIKSFVEKETLKKYKSSLPPNHIPKVNRTKKKSMPAKRIIAGTLTFVISTSIIAGLINKEIAKTEQITSESISISYTEQVKKSTIEPKASINTSPDEATLIDDDSIKIDLAFPDETANGKLEQTKELCSPYLDYWINRYGLPKDLTYALVSQEYGVLDCTINSSGACGPMQLQVASFHNDNAIEKIKVAVYNNGVPTGEYDEFYVADERKLDDPRLAGQNYLVMQNLEDNFRIGCAQLRRCIDKYKNIFLAIDAYNKGMYAFSSSCDDATLAYYKEHPEDFSWTSIIPNHFGENYGDKDYIWHVLRYLDTDTRGEANIEYNYEGELIKIDLTNTNVYNSELKR